MDTRKSILINGNWISSDTFEVKVSPTLGKPIYEFSSASATQVKQAVVSCTEAFFHWSTLSWRDRVKLVLRFADVCERRKNEISETVVEDIGKPHVEAETEVIETCDIIRYFSKRSYDCLDAQILPVDSELWHHKQTILLREPLGVIAVIKPWNYPFELPLWAIVPLLIAGNTLVFKPSEHSTKTGCLIASLILDAGIPPGVLNVVTGSASTGEALVAEEGITGISFTGSVATGKRIGESASARMLSLSLELGGNDAALVLSDANVDLTVSGIAWGAFTNAGQVCTSVQRVLVHESLYDVIRAKMVETAESLRPTVDYGPLISSEHLNKVKRFVADAVSKGASICCGGRQPDDLRTVHGNYYLPTIIENLDRDALLWAEEVFGPVISLSPFTTDCEAVKLANDSLYGLGASIWTCNHEHALDLSHELNVGMVWINEVNLPMPSAPWVGRKASGIGLNLSDQAILDATKPKAIHVDRDTIKRSWWFPYK